MTANKNSVELTAEEEKEARENLLYYADLIEYLDIHDTGDDLEGMPEVHFEISLPPRRTHFPILPRNCVKQRGNAARLPKAC